MKEYTTLINAEQLKDHIHQPDLVIVDCQFSLEDTKLGRRNYLSAHIPGAVFADLEQDLSGEIIPGKTSRHPLPEITTFAATLSQWGIDKNTQVFAYDNLHNAAAARLWWMLRWLGHQRVAVLDGGIARWSALGYPTRSGEEKNKPRTFVPNERPELIVHADEILAQRVPLLIDSRTAPRYYGEEEPIDPVAGHIPGARNFSYQLTLTPDGCFQDIDTLKELFTNLLGGIPAQKTTFYCGSGVTAVVNILALMHAGLGEARIYSDSWSGWITDPTRPIATTEQ